MDRLERICLLQPHIETETEGTRTLLFINIRSYNERSDGSYIPKNKTDFLTILSLMLSCYFQEKQRSFTSGDFWVLPRWQVTNFQFLSVFQDGGHVKFPTLGKARSVNFLWVACPPPPPTLGLNIDRCINPNIKIQILICCSCTFSIEEVGRIC